MLKCIEDNKVPKDQNIFLKTQIGENVYSSTPFKKQSIMISVIDICLPLSYQ